MKVRNSSIPSRASVVSTTNGGTGRALHLGGLEPAGDDLPPEVVDVADVPHQFGHVPLRAAGHSRHQPTVSGSGQRRAFTAQGVDVLLGLHDRRG
jgi:hypothetical protein